MLDFRPITIEDKKLYEKYNDHRDYVLADYCFTDLFIWRNTYDLKICPTDDYLYISSFSTELNSRIYGVPLSKSKDIKTPIDIMRQDASEKGIPFVLAYLTQPEIDLIEQQLPNTFRYEEDTTNANYIYLSEKLITLGGKKLHAKRNYINRFKKDYEGRWSYKNIEPSDIKALFSYHLKWCEQNDCTHSEDLLHEVCGVSQALRNYEALDLKGGLLFLDDEIIAYTLGSQGGDNALVIQIEKANHDITGAYQMINQQFAQHNAHNYKYINREEDMGLEGLKKSKLSYYPEIILKNYIAFLK